MALDLVTEHFHQASTRNCRRDAHAMWAYLERTGADLPEEGRRGGYDQAMDLEAEVLASDCKVGEFRLPQPGTTRLRC